MSGISSALNKRLRKILIDCGSFSSNQALAAIFVDSRISMFANSLPESINIESRVDLLIHYLHNKFDDHGQSALFLFLHVLLDRISKQTSCYQKISRLIIDFEKSSNINEVENASIQVEQLDFDKTQIFEILIKHFNEEELKTLCFYLKLDFDELPGDNLSGKARELIKYYSRRENLHILVKKINQIRPDISIC